MKKKLIIILLFFILYFLFSSLRENKLCLFSIYNISPVWAKETTGECCRLGHSEDCDRLGEGNYICDRAVDPGCEDEGGECMLIGPYGTTEKKETEFQTAVKIGEEEGVQSKEFFDWRTFGHIALTLKGILGGTTESIAYKKESGAIALVSNLVGTLYITQPASSVEYLADLGSNLVLGTPAHAQGFGWSAFSPVLKLWKIFRNIAYLFFVIIFVVIGFMIMFRVKIDPQTVISVQNALPRIIVTLLLITFSYAIAGFIVDLGQLATRIIGNALGGAKLMALRGARFDQTTLESLLTTDIFRLVNPLRNPSMIAQQIAQIEIAPTQIIPSWLTEITVSVIFWLAGFFIMFKIFFALIGPYVGIVLSIIFAPFQLLIGALPGVGGVGSWLKTLIANVMVFPVTFTMLAIAAIIRGPSTYSGANWGVPVSQEGVFWAPPTIGNWGGAVPHLIAFGILFAIPQVAKITKGVVEGKGIPPEAGEAIREEIRGAVARVPLVKTFVRV